MCFTIYEGIYGDLLLHSSEAHVCVHLANRCSKCHFCIVNKVKGCSERRKGLMSQVFLSLGQLKNDQLPSDLISSAFLKY